MQRDAPPPEPSPNDVADWEFRLIQIEVASFRRRARLPSWVGLEDLTQDCLIHWLRVRKNYQRERGASPETFLKRTIRNHLKDELARLTAAKRGGGQPDISLDEPVHPQPEGANGSRHELIADAHPAADTAGAAERAEFVEVLREGRGALAAADQPVFDLLAAGHNASDIARMLDRARTTVNDQIRRIRRTLPEERLRGYL